MQNVLADKTVPLKLDHRCGFNRVIHQPLLSVTKERRVCVCVFVVISVVDLSHLRKIFG